MGIHRLPNGIVSGAALRTAHATARPMRCSVRCPQRSGSTGMTNLQMTKATRGRVRTPKAFAKQNGLSRISHEVLWECARVLASL
jgi:hypothetical protein